jgi:hypothetical protein
MIKPEPMNPKQFKELLILLLVIFFIVMCFDYFATTEIVIQSKALQRISYKGGELLRAFYFAVFSATCFYNAKGNFQPRKYFPLENRVKIILFIISLICVVALLMVNSFPCGVNIFLYPILFLISNISIATLILSYACNDLKVNLDMTELGPEQNRSDKQFAITLDAHEGVVNIPNPFRSVLVIGGAGAGKSASIAEPAIYHLIKKQFAGYVYDLKWLCFLNILSFFNFVD